MRLGLVGSDCIWLSLTKTWSCSLWHEWNRLDLLWNERISFDSLGFALRRVKLLEQSGFVEIGLDSLRFAWIRFKKSEFALRRLESSGFVWIRLDSLEIAQRRVELLGCALRRVDSLGLPWIRFKKSELALTRVDLLGFAWIRLWRLDTVWGEWIRLDSVGFAWNCLD